MQELLQPFSKIFGQKVSGLKENEQTEEPH